MFKSLAPNPPTNIRLLVCGSRSIIDKKWVYAQIDEYLKSFAGIPITIIQGEAKGVDSLAKRYAIDHNLLHEDYPADWENLGISAGYIRNNTMVNTATHVLVLWDGASKGSEHSIKLARQKNKPLTIITYS